MSASLSLPGGTLTLPHTRTWFDVARFVCQVLPIAIDIPCTSNYSIWITLSSLISFDPTEDDCAKNFSDPLPKEDIKVTVEYIPFVRGLHPFFNATISWSVSSGKQFLKQPVNFLSFVLFFLSYFLLFFLFLNFFSLAPLQDLEYAFWETPILLSCNGVLASVRHGQFGSNGNSDLTWHK